MQIPILCYRTQNSSVDYVIMILSFPRIRLVNTLQPYLEKLLCWILQLQQFLYVLPINAMFKINMNDLETKSPLSDSQSSSTYRHYNYRKGGSLIVLQTRSNRPLPWSSHALFVYHQAEIHRRRASQITGPSSRSSATRPARQCALLRKPSQRPSPLWHSPPPCSAPARPWARTSPATSLASWWPRSRSSAL